MDDGRAIRDLRTLAVRDEELAARERRLHELDGTVHRLRGRAEEIGSFFAHYHAAAERLQSELEAGQTDVERRRAQVAEAETTLAGEDDEERRELARRAVSRARDHLSVAETALARTRTDSEELQRDAQRLQHELPELEQRARQLAPDLPNVAPPDPGAQPLIEWASHAHAALFVAVRQVDAERERVIREANELASALLAEPTYGSTAAQALARAEQRVGYA